MSSVTVSNSPVCDQSSCCHLSISTGCVVEWSNVAFEVDLLHEALGAQVAGIWSFPGVNAHMSVQVWGKSKPLATDLTYVLRLRPCQSRHPTHLRETRRVRAPPVVFSSLLITLPYSLFLTCSKCLVPPQTHISQCIINNQFNLHLCTKVLHNNCYIL